MRKQDKTPVIIAPVTGQPVQTKPSMWDSILRK